MKKQNLEKYKNYKQIPKVQEACNNIVNNTLSRRMKLNTKIYFKNLNQKIIFLVELLNQFEDGLWKKSKTMNSSFWKNFNWDNTLISNKAGIENCPEKFENEKVNRNIRCNTKKVIKNLKDKLTFLVKCANTNEKFVEAFKKGIIIDSPQTFDKIFKNAIEELENENYDGEWVQLADNIRMLNIDELDIMDAEKFEYTEKDLKNDLSELTKALKTDLR